MANYTVLLALFLRVREVVSQKLCSKSKVGIVEWQNPSNFFVSQFVKSCFLICSVRKFCPSKWFCVISFSTVSHHSAWYLLGKRNGCDEESALNYCDCATLKYEFCHGTAIIFNTLTPLYPLVMCEILVVIISITSEINYINIYMFIILWVSQQIPS